jgi:hypothetical protein
MRASRSAGVELAVLVGVHLREHLAAAPACASARVTTPLPSDRGLHAAHRMGQGGAAAGREGDGRKADQGLLHLENLRIWGKSEKPQVAGKGEGKPLPLRLSEPM